MGSYMQVVLREDVNNLGTSGDVVKVRPGYARNYLLPRGLATAATRGNLAQIEHERQAARVRAAKMRNEAEGIAAALAEVVVQVPKQVGDAGKLYGSVTASDVANVLQSKGYNIDRRKLQMPDQPIKELGSYEITAKLAQGVAPTFRLEVVSAE